MVAQANGNAFLIEEVPYTALTNLVGVLPLHSSNIKPAKNIRRTASLNPPPRQPSAAKSAAGVMKIARGGLRDAQKPGLVIDYTLNGSDHASSNFIFQCDTTYFVSGVWSFYGSPGTIVFEGGSVVKYTTNATIYNYGSSIGVFEGAMYRPSVFTSWQDNSVGTPIAGSSGSPSYVPSSTYYIEEAGEGSSSNFISNARFSYADYAYVDYSDPVFTFRDCQFVDCITVTFTPYCNHIYFQNILCSSNYDVFSGYGGPENVDAENITVDGCTAFALTNSWWGPCTYSGGITNSILTDCDSSTSLFTTDHSKVTGSGSAIYTNVGAGGYYLANGTYRGAGTTMINPGLLLDLATLTTYAPFILPTYITANTNLAPQVSRNTGTPDIGYHYCPLDYAINAVVSNATITVQPGTALGMYGSGYGISLNGSAAIQSLGTAASPIHLVSYNTVQEQSNTNWDKANSMVLILLTGAGDSGSSSFTFSDWSVFWPESHVVDGDLPGPTFEFQNCQFYSGQLYSLQASVLSTNSFYERVAVSMGDSGGDFAITFCNNLFRYGSLFYSHDGTGSWTFRDNLFDQCAITNKATEEMTVCSNNAYATDQLSVPCTPLTPTNTSVFLSNSPSYLTGGFGQFYYPVTQTNLINKGSRSASAAGLSYYTTCINNRLYTARGIKPIMPPPT